MRVCSTSTGEYLGPVLQHHWAVPTAHFFPGGERVFTASYESTAQVWDMPSITWAVSDVVREAELMTGMSIDGSGKPTPCGRSLLNQHWRELRVARPESFRSGADRASRWHEQQLFACELAQDWFAANFHLQKLAAINPRHPSLLEARDRIIACQPVPRDPKATSNLLDLSAFYNTSLSENWEYSYAGKNLGELPRGIQTLAGVQFDVRGAIRIVDYEDEFLKRRLPARITGIPVRQHCRRLHFLHASGGEHNIVGVQIGTYNPMSPGFGMWNLEVWAGWDQR